MAKAKTEAKEEMLRVRYVGLPGPPARLEAGEVVIEAGNEGELPAALARELAMNPEVGLELLDEELPTPEEEPATAGTAPNGEPILEHVNPPADEPEKE